MALLDTTNLPHEWRLRELNKRSSLNRHNSLIYSAPGFIINYKGEQIISDNIQYRAVWGQQNADGLVPKGAYKNTSKGVITTPKTELPGCCFLQGTCHHPIFEIQQQPRISAIY